jgi:hypothetical protein
MSIHDWTVKELLDEACHLTGSGSVGSARRLHLRDLRLIAQVGSEFGRPAVIARQSATIVTLEHIRGIILQNAVLLVAKTGEEKHYPESQSMGEDLTRLQDQLSSPPPEGQAFEFYALEVLLGAAHDQLGQEIARARKDLADKPRARKMRTSLSSQKELTFIDDFRKLGRMVDSLYARAQGVCAALSSVLDDDDDLALMCLSQDYGTDSDAHDVAKDELEVMVELWWQSFANLNDSVGGLRLQLQTEQNELTVRSSLANTRFVRSNLVFRVCNFALQLGSMIPALLGMNFPGFFDRADEPPNIFNRASGGLVGASLSVLFLALLLAHKYVE